MNITSLQKKFKKIGADIKIIEQNTRGRGEYTVNVRRGTFIVTVDPSEAKKIEVSTVDVDVEDRHILLNISLATRKGKEKDKWLCGHDERDFFVGAVPNVVGSLSVKNIWEAKQALKPSVVLGVEKAIPHKQRNKRRNKAHIRQGEWFFIPVEDMVVNKLLIHKKEPISRGAGSKPHIIDEVYREGGTTVYVNRTHPNGITETEYKALSDKARNPASDPFKIMKRDAAVYARGNVKHADHATINLLFWHKVLMNTEGNSRRKKNLVFLD